MSQIPISRNVSLRPNILKPRFREIRVIKQIRDSEIP